MLPIGASSTDTVWLRFAPATNWPLILAILNMYWIVTWTETMSEWISTRCCVARRGISRLSTQQLALGPSVILINQYVIQWIQ